jgi:hypothetical protein
MSANAAANLFIDSPFRVGFYQYMFGSVASFQKLGNRLVRFAENAHAVRQIEIVREAAEILSNIPLDPYQSIGQFYLAWCERKNGDRAIKILEKLAESAPAKYRARAMHVLATIAARRQDSETEFRWLTESLRVCPSVEGFRGLAVLKAREGFHASALKGLEELIPLIGHTEPLPYYDFLNSYAVELGNAGHKQEARNIARLVLMSPFARAYPEWQETALELKEPDRSFVVIPTIPKILHNVLSMPALGHGAKTQIRYNRPARILNMQQWKKKMGKDDAKDDNLTPEQKKAMTASEKLVYIMKSITSDFTDEDLDRIVDLLDEINSRKKG